MLLALAGVLALLLPLPAAPAAAQTAGHLQLPEAMPGDRLLVSHRTDEGHLELHTVNWDARERTVLTSGETDFAGTWSPDGRHVAFHRIQAPADGLYVVTSDGAATVRLDDWGYSPSWSPDSDRLVYSPSTEADPVPLRITTLGGSSTSVPGTTGGADPVWSPDGAWIAYVQPGRSELVVVRPDGSDRRVLAPDAFDVRWSPDSAQLAYVTGGREGGPADPDSRLMLVRRDGTQARQLARFPRILQPAFSPSGRDIAFSARTSGGPLNIWRVELADGSAHQLTEFSSDDMHPTWVAGTHAIAFTRNEDVNRTASPTNVWWAHPGGGHTQRITDTGSDHAVDFAPGLTLRLAGVDRIRTAVQLSRTFPSADAVVIARADDHPDALAGGPLAAALDAPVLLTGRDRLHPSVHAELARLGARRAYLLGGPGALSPQVQSDLADAGITDVTRLAGADRFATAAAVADELRRLAGVPERVFVVEGHHPDPRRGWPDALSASGVASLAGEAILLVTRDRIPQATMDAVQVSGAGRAVIVGGPGAVSEAVEARLAEHVGDIERVAGADRYETSARAADLAVAAGARAAHPWLATGRNWPDALAAAPAIAGDGGALLLVDGGTWRLPSAVEMWLMDVHDPRPQRAVIVGGPSAVGPETRTTIENTLTAGP